MKLRDRHLVGVGAAACAVCCAAPVLGVLGIAGVGLAATAATFAFAGLTFVAVMAVATITGILVRRRQSGATPPPDTGCGDSCGCGRGEVSGHVLATTRADRALHPQ